MDDQRAIEILIKHNVWRRGRSETPTHPRELGEALDYVIERLQGLSNVA